jgi:hypothetical protein
MGRPKKARSDVTGGHVGPVLFGHPTEPPVSPTADVDYVQACIDVINLDVNSLTDDQAKDQADTLCMKIRPYVFGDLGDRLRQVPWRGAEQHAAEIAKAGEPARAEWIVTGLKGALSTVATEFLKRPQAYLRLHRGRLEARLEGVELNARISLRPDGRLMHEVSYSPMNNDASAALFAALLMDPERDIGARLRRCAFADCGLLFLRSEERRKYCSTDHQLAADRADTAERVRRYRERNAK